MWPKRRALHCGQFGGGWKGGKLIVFREKEREEMLFPWRQCSVYTSRNVWQSAQQSRCVIWSVVTCLSGRKEKGKYLKAFKEGEKVHRRVLENPLLVIQVITRTEQIDAAFS